MVRVDTSLAATALPIALVALFTTLIQVLQQFFATAEGYRRCNSSVMGPWARMTHKRWQWMEFCYETIYTSPEFFVVGPSTNIVPGQQSGGQFHLITGDNDSLRMTMTPPVQDLKSNEQVCWIPFLQALHNRSRDLLGEESIRQFITYPALRRQERSWNFMPPDVVRPLASSNLSDICILIRRLGMAINEDEFRPYVGILNAQGAGHVITSTMVRGVGLVLQYIHWGDHQPTVKLGQPDSSKQAFIWKPEADQMGFGILPGNPDFSLPDFAMGTEDDVLARLLEIDRSGGAENHVRENLKVNLHWVIAFTDIIPLAAPMLRIRGSTAIRVPRPFSNIGCLVYHAIGFKVFHYQLRAMTVKDEAQNCSRPQRIKVLQLYERLKEKYSDVWEDEHEAERRFSLQFLEDVHDCYDETTTYFQLLERQNQTMSDGTSSRFKYFDLVKAHIAKAVFFWPECAQVIQKNGGREHFNTRVGWHAEGMHVYFDFLPRYVEWMKAAGCHDEELIKDAWVTLIFRGFCWHRCHLLVEGPRVPSQYYGSRQPVYIG